MEHVKKSKLQTSARLRSVIPAKAGIHFSRGNKTLAWVPAFAGTTLRPGFQAFQPIRRFFHTLCGRNRLTALMCSPAGHRMAVTPQTAQVSNNLLFKPLSRPYFPRGDASIKPAPARNYLPKAASDSWVAELFVMPAIEHALLKKERQPDMALINVQNAANWPWRLLPFPAWLPKVNRRTLPADLLQD